MASINTWKLTNFSKFLILILFAFVGLGGAWQFGAFDSMKTEVKTLSTTINTTRTQPAPSTNTITFEQPQTPVASTLSVASTTKSSKPVRISLDEWIGWKPIFDANGGLTTQRGSIFDKLGLNIEIVIINDATQSSNALISNDLKGAGFTLNRLAYLMDKFDRANTQILVPFLVNNSAGGDGIISRKGITSIENLAGKRIVAPRFSEAQTLVYWLLMKSNLTPPQIDDIVKNMILVNTPDEAAKVFFSGKADAAATWQPYLDQANDPNADTHALITTKNMTNFILDVMVFRRDFYENNKEFVAKFADGVFQAHKMYTTEFSFIKSMPNFTSSSNEEIKGMTGDAVLAGYKRNIDSLSPGGVGPAIFQDMLAVWKEIGEPAKIGHYADIFDTTALSMLDSKYTTDIIPVVTYTESQRVVAKAAKPLMTKSLTIEFDVNSAVFKDPKAVASTLDDIVNQLNVVDNAIVQIEGNTSSEGSKQLNIELSQNRANAVAKYLMRAGINPARLVVLGNGPDNPIADNNTQAGRIKNRRTDVKIKPVD